MAIESFKKQSWEEFVIAASVEEVIDDEELIVLGSCDVKAWQFDDLDTEVTSDVVEIATLEVDNTLHYLKVRIKGGDETAGDDNQGDYKITFYVVTDQANKYEVDVKMKVREY